MIKPFDPGTAEAREFGCTCPNDGQLPAALFLVSKACSLHGQTVWGGDPAGYDSTALAKREMIKSWKESRGEPFPARVAAKPATLDSETVSEIVEKVGVALHAGA